MWTQASRGRMAEIARKTKRYPTDLTDEEWEGVRPFLPKPAKRGRKPKTDLREVLNAIRYLARSGVSWDMLPRDFPPSGTVYWWFRRFVRRFLFETIHDMAVMIDRERVGREASPSAGVVDSQTQGGLPRRPVVTTCKVPVHITGRSRRLNKNLSNVATSVEGRAY